MNITTHGKDGPRAKFFAPERRIIDGAYAFVDEVQQYPRLGEIAELSGKLAPLLGRLRKLMNDDAPIDPPGVIVPGDKTKGSM